jgi:hypothetical protein
MTISGVLRQAVTAIASVDAIAPLTPATSSKRGRFPGKPVSVMNLNSKNKKKNYYKLTTLPVKPVLVNAIDGNNTYAAVFLDRILRVKQNRFEYYRAGEDRRGAAIKHG